MIIIPEEISIIIPEICSPEIIPEITPDFFCEIAPETIPQIFCEIITDLFVK